MSANEHSDIYRPSLLSKLTGKFKADEGADHSSAMPRIPRFDLVAKLGEGGMASVFLAEQQGTGRQVAVKIMAKHLQGDSRWTERFLDEARRLAELSHSNIVPVIDWGTHEGIGYIVMEYMKCGDLTYRVDNVPLTVRDTMEMIRQIASGLDFAAEKGYVHRDIKPDNILFREDGSPCILDFGIAKDGSSNTTYSSQGLPIGTGAYMSPEQAQPGGHKLDGRSDLYSVGVLLYQLLTGARPFDYANYEAAKAFQLYVFAHVNSPRPPLSQRFHAFQPVIDKLLAKDPNDRFSRGNELRQALTALESQLPASLLDSPIRDLDEPGHTASSVATLYNGSSDTYFDRQFPGEFDPGFEPLPNDSVRGDRFFDTRGEPLATSAKTPSNKSGGWLSKLVILALLGFIGFAVVKREQVGSVLTGGSVVNSEPQPLVNHSASETAPAALAPGEADGLVAEQDSNVVEQQQLQALRSQVETLRMAAPDDLASQSQLASVYSQILDIKANDLQAVVGTDELVTAQHQWVKQALQQGKTEGVPSRIALVEGLDPLAASQLRVAYDALIGEQEVAKLEAQKQSAQEQNAVQVKSLEAEVLAFIDTAIDSSPRSRGSLINAVSSINKAKQLGLSEELVTYYERLVSQRYSEMVRFSLNTNQLERAKDWLRNFAPVPLTRFQIEDLSNEVRKQDSSFITPPAEPAKAFVDVAAEAGGSSPGKVIPLSSSSEPEPTSDTGAGAGAEVEFTVKPYLPEANLDTSSNGAGGATPFEEIQPKQLETNRPIPNSVPLEPQTDFEPEVIPGSALELELESEGDRPGYPQDQPIQINPLED